QERGGRIVGRPEAQRQIRRPPAARHADGFLLVIALGDPGGLSDWILGLQGGGHRSGRSHTDLGAVQAGADAAHGRRGRARHEAAIARQTLALPACSSNRRTGNDVALSTALMGDDASNRTLVAADVSLPGAVHVQRARSTPGAAAPWFKRYQTY